MARPQSIIELQFDLTRFSDSLVNQLLEFREKLVGVDQFWVQRLATGKSEKLCGELGPATSGAPCRGGIATNAANVSVMLDQFKVRRDHSK